jgi:hypothetical protein
MLSLIVSVLAGVLGALGICIIGGAHWGWGIFLGIVIFFAVLILLSRHFGKKLQGVAEQVQVQIGESQSDAQRIINRFQSKPSSQKVLQSQVEKVMEAGVVQALETLDGASPIFKWNVLAERQINTLKMQLNFQIKRFEEADRLMSKILILEPLTLAMKMTRQYHNDDEGLEKSFRKGVKKFKYEKATLIYSVYAWMLLKRKALDEALEVLTEAKDKTENEGVAKNWQHVANNKVHLYSNAALGEQWYALHLEQPPKAKASKGQTKNHPMAQKGRRKYR